MQKQTTVCDECGAEKGVSNHWLQAHAVENELITFTKTSLSRSGNVTDLCGAACAAKVLQRWLSTGKLTEG